MKLQGINIGLLVSECMHAMYIINANAREPYKCGRPPEVVKRGRVHPYVSRRFGGKRLVRTPGGPYVIHDVLTILTLSHK